MGLSVIPTGLRDALRSAAASRHLLLASDFDGCMAPIVSHPDDAAPTPGSVAAIAEAAALPSTSAAVVSGRSLADLSQRSTLGTTPGVTLIGSHGSESGTGFSQPVTDADRQRLTELIADLETIAADHPGVHVEVKPISTVLHVRNASDEDARIALDRARSGPATRAGVEATEGKAVLELAVIKTSKGHALDALREQVGADTVIYIGDDVTDEKAFAHLQTPTSGGSDIGIKVGEGDTIADHRIADPEAVVEVLEFITAERREFLGH